jgi:hypothetical protein
MCAITRGVECSARGFLQPELIGLGARGIYDGRGLVQGQELDERTRRFMIFLLIKNNVSLHVINITLIIVIKNNN